ncbi:hypothetical protein Sjap_015804 [Stephania japonica]|uniref:Uncharacterized protein n=1 Tax=Stephania japonica TaxID=461633 RepID=A0AAP0NR78_9MAGN
MESIKVLLSSSCVVPFEVAKWPSKLAQARNPSCWVAKKRFGGLKCRRSEYFEQQEQQRQGFSNSRGSGENYFGQQQSVGDPTPPLPPDLPPRLPDLPAAAWVSLLQIPFNPSMKVHNPTASLSSKVVALMITFAPTLHLFKLGESMSLKEVGSHVSQQSTYCAVVRLSTLAIVTVTVTSVGRPTCIDALMLVGLPLLAQSQKFLQLRKHTIHAPIALHPFAGALRVGVDDFILPYLMGWHTFADSIRPDDAGRINNNSRGGTELEWSR